MGELAKSRVKSASLKVGKSAEFVNRRYAAV